MSEAASSANASRIRVLDSGPAATQLAASLALPTRSSIPSVGEAPVVVVVCDRQDVDDLLAVEDRWWVGCVVAWQLPERQLTRLFDAGLNAVVGLPTVAELVAAVDYPATAEQQVSARRLAERLATLEHALSPD